MPAIYGISAGGNSQPAEQKTQGAVAQGIQSYGSGLLGTVAGAIIGRLSEKHNDKRQLEQQEKLQNLQIAGSEKLTDYNYAKQLQMWHDTNYGAQMEELNKAGLNAGLIYGMSGGGATTTGNGNAQVTGGQAPSGGHESIDRGTQALAIGQQIMQRQMMQAQIDVAESQAKLNEANAAKTSGVDTQLAGTQVASITQGINNQQAQEALTKTQNAIATIQQNIQNQTQQETIDQAINTTRQMDEQLQILINQNTITTEQAVNARATATEQLTALTLQNDATRTGINKTKEEINQISNSIAQKWKQIQLEGQRTNNDTKMTELQNWIHDTKDSWKVAAETVGDIVKVVVGKGSIGKTGTTTTETYSEPGYSHSTTTHKP